MRTEYRLFLLALVCALAFGGCATNPKYRLLKDEPWYQEVNPMNPQSDWAGLDITPDTLTKDDPPHEDIQQDMMDIIDYY